MKNIKLLGDVHAGKKFLNDVPLHRRGEREEEVLKQLEEELKVTPEIEFHIQVGDLFDSFDVPNEVILRVADIYKAAAKENPGCTYVVYPGNHDRSRDSSKVSAFELFAAIVKSVQTIWVVWEPSTILSNQLRYGILPWDPFKSAEELAVLLPCDVPLEAVFTHCDTVAFGDNTFNLLPIERLSKITKKVFNGHVHTPSVTEPIKGLTVTNVGSMQPYSHSEDPESLRYLTVTPDELSKLSAPYLKDKYVRVRLHKGEPIPEAPDCMGFKVIYTNEKEAEEEKLVVEFEDFNTRNLFISCLSELKVSEGTQKKILERFDDVH